MHFFRESLLDWHTHSGFIFPFDESRRAFKNIWTIENFQSQVDEAMNEYTISVPKLPNLSEKQKDLAYFIHNQIKKDNNIFHIEEGKRKNYKRKFIKKNSVLSKEATHECPCCETRYRQKHRCQHTICEKPCLRQKKSNENRMRRLKKQNSPSEVSMNSFEKESQSQNSFENYEDPSVQLDSQQQSISDIKTKKNLHIKKQEIENHNKMEEQNRQNINNHNKTDKLEKIDKKDESIEIKNISNERILDAQPHTENNIEQVKKPEESRKRGRGGRQPKQPQKRSKTKQKKKLLNDPIEHSSKEIQSQFIPVESHQKSSKQEIIDEDKNRKSRGGSKRRRKSVRPIMQSPLETSSLVHSKKRRSVLILEQPSSVDESLQSYDSPPREKKQFKDFCEPELLKVDKIFAVDIDLGEPCLKGRGQKGVDEGKRRRTRKDSSKKEKSVSKGGKGRVQKKVIKKDEKSSIKDEDISYKIESYLIVNEPDDHQKAEKPNLKKLNPPKQSKQESCQKQQIRQQPSNETFQMIRPIYVPEEIQPIQYKHHQKQQVEKSMHQQENMNQIEMEYPINEIEGNILEMLEEDRHEVDSQENIMKLVDEIEQNSPEHSEMSALFYKRSRDPNNSEQNN